MSDMTTRDQPPRCEQSIYDHGKHLATIAGPRSFTLEDWIVKVRGITGEPLDWHYVGGYAQILGLGDVHKTCGVMKLLWDELVDAYMACTDNFVTTAERRHVQILWHL